LEVAQLWFDFVHVSKRKEKKEEEDPRVEKAGTLQPILGHGQMGS